MEFNLSALGSTPASEDTYDVVIIGGGPAGLTAGIYAGRAQLKTVIVEKGLPGGQIAQTDEVENYPGFPEGISGPELASRMVQQAEKFGARIVMDEVLGLEKAEGGYLVRGYERNYRARAVIVATGANPRRLGVPGEDKFYGRGVSTCATCDGFFYKKQDVAVVGGGNTAVEEALYLANIANTVTLIHRRDSFRAEKIMVDKLMRRVEEGKIILKTEAVLEEVLGDDSGVIGARLKFNDGRSEDIAVKGVFIAIGHKPNTDIFKGQLDMDDAGYLKTKGGSGGDVGATNIEGIWAAGDVKDHTYRQAITSAASGCQAALDAERWLDGQH